MPSNSEFSKLVLEYNRTLEKSKQERVNRLDLSFKEGAMKAVEQAQKVFGIDLDLSEQSLQEVEFIMEELHNTVKRLDPTEKWIDQVVRFYAGYIGHIIQTHWQGEWRSELEYPIKKGPALKIRGKDFFLLNQVRQRLMRGQEYNIVEYYQGLMGEIAEMDRATPGGPIPDTEETSPDIAVISDNTSKLETSVETPSIAQGLDSTNLSVIDEVEQKQDFAAVEWIISVSPVDRKNQFLRSEITNIFNSAWRETAGFSTGLVEIYGLPPGDVRWYCLDETQSPPERYSLLEIRCNLLAIYYGKRNLNPRYLEIYCRTVGELFNQFRFNVKVTPQLSFEEGVARIKNSPLLKL
ncbi:MAG TPA: hypothetical protein VEC37_03340 [Bacillota bacterium]|nr:hypothetical protein [Bacillota bacterium]